MNAQMLLKDLARLPHSDARETIAARAREGRYHVRDFSMPSAELAIDLLEAGFYKLAAQASQGRYDDDPGRT